MSETGAAEGSPEVPPPPSRKVRFALVGLGKLAVEEILPALRQSNDCEVSALVSDDPDKARAIGLHCGVGPDAIYTYEDMHRLAGDDRVDAVYIATPNTLHKRDTLAAAQAGKHVLCEKPLAGTSGDCREMIDACARAGVKLMTAYRVHHEPINRQIRDWLREEKYGKPRLLVYDTTRGLENGPQYRLDAERAGGGSLLDIGIYALNGCRWLLGEEPVEIRATQHNDPSDKRFREIEQTIAFQLLFPSGCIANCTSSYGTTRNNRYRVMCEKGWLGMEPATSYRGLSGEHGDDEQRVTMLTPKEINQFAAEFDHFARCVRDGEEVESPGEEGLKDVQLMELIYQAAREARVIRV